MVARSRSESRLRASSKRLWLEEGLEGACGDDEVAALAFGPVDGDGDEPWLLDLKFLRSRSRRLSFMCGVERPDMFDEV